MNINKSIVNRALEIAGQEALTQKDIETDSARWRLIKSIYLSTILETLSNTEWTSRKKRAKLSMIEGENFTQYSFCYALPDDCAKPESLEDNIEYIVEGNRLYTESEEATLLYISNGKISPVKRTVELEPESADDTDETLRNNYELPEDYIEFVSMTYSGSTMTLTYWSDSPYLKNDDYPEYADIEFDPLLSEYIETRLASKIALKITGDQQLYNLLYGEALLMEQRAIKSTLTHSKSKANGNEFWGEQLGLD